MAKRSSKKSTKVAKKAGRRISAATAAKQLRNKARKTSGFPHVTFTFNQEYLDDNGLWNPRDEDTPLESGFQVNVFGRREHFLRLAEAIREFADREIGNDSNFHEHFEGLLSVNGKVRLHIILRRNDI